MRPSSTSLIAIVAGVALAVPAVLSAQGALSNQGFGYPLGQLSAGALGSGGAGAESDASSPINPSAITQNTRYSVVLQFEPEFRRTTGGGLDSEATLVRFPGFQLSGAMGRFTGAAGVSTLLDRTWSNFYEDSIVVGGEWVPSRIFTASSGAISDVRVALGYIVSSRIQVGIGLHGIAGENRTEFVRSFPDSLLLGGLQQEAAWGFTGSAVSLGATLQPTDKLAIGASMRSGGRMTVEEAGSADPETGQGAVPTRFGIGVSWLAVPGASLSARIDQTRWTDMEGLGSSDLSLFDATEIALGVDALGPRLLGANSVLRAGFRDRTLPFGVQGSQVSERSITVGAGLPVARGRAQVDLAVQRASREVREFRERGWFVSIGLGIRP